ncbi:hypothetical protein [Paenibacillus cymbidii]|uniref:hypothetical protein n=1 Tax=Paenibacillus cymbidii TaxID=1639034 RepID=UPI001080B80F|nr:hypothetical protein [Paenibacillus cymbidii]
MSIEDQLASSLGERGEEPNIALAERIAASGDAAAVAELIGLLRGRTKPAQSDSIKVLYEIGERAPHMIAGEAETFLALLAGSNNRLVWGAMTALAAIARVRPEAVAPALDTIADAARDGSVITRDQAVRIFAALSADADDRYPAAWRQLLVQLRSCPPNQLPMYAELALPAVRAERAAAFAAALAARLDDVAGAKRRRVEKVLGRV